ncbi:MAG: hypothetical protein AAGE93_19980 [Bacteroidota bacterium]
MESITDIVPLVIGLITAFMALTAIGGGIAIITRVDKFPLAWLRSTLFRSYTIPALILSVIVGGSSLVAAILYFASNPVYPVYAMLAGLIMVGFILVEIRILDQGNPGATRIELFYLTLGAAVFILSAIIWFQH